MRADANDRWFGFSRKAILIAFAVIVAINLLWVLLALTSTTPYVWHWTSHGNSVDVIRLYWDGRTAIESYPRTGWTLLAECAIWSFLVAAILASGYLVLRWLRAPRRVPVRAWRLLAWSLAATILFASAYALAAFLER